jgi:hypothetical protein
MIQSLEDYVRHYSLSSDEDLSRLSLDVQSLVPEAREALRLEMERRSLPVEAIDWTAQPPAPPAMLPYSWGNFQGWMLLICGVIAVFVMLGRGDNSGFLDAILSAYTGYALIKRKPNAIILFYVGTGIAALFALVLDIRAIAGIFTITTETVGNTITSKTAENVGYLSGEAIVQTALTVGWWLIPALTYYRKRQPEFRKHVGAAKVHSLKLFK